MDVPTAADSPLTPPPRLSVVIPARNEAHRLPGNLAGIAAYLEDRFPGPGLDYEVLVVVEQGTDNTLTRCREAAAGRAGFEVIDNGPHRGKGYAVRSGLRRARGRRAPVHGRGPRHAVGGDRAVPGRVCCSPRRGCAHRRPPPGEPARGSAGTVAALARRGLRSAGGVGGQGHSCRRAWWTRSAGSRRSGRGRRRPSFPGNGWTVFPSTWRCSCWRRAWGCGWASCRCRAGGTPPQAPCASCATAGRCCATWEGCESSWKPLCKSPPADI